MALPLQQIWHSLSVPSVPVFGEPAVITFHCRFWASKSEIIGDGQKQTVKVHITASLLLEPTVNGRWYITLVLATNRQWCGDIIVGFWLKPTMINWHYKKLSSSLPSRAHPSSSLAFSPLPLLCGRSSPRSSWIFKHEHDLLALRLVTSTHFFDFVALPLFW